MVYCPVVVIYFYYTPILLEFQSLFLWLGVLIFKYILDPLISWSHKGNTKCAQVVATSIYVKIGWGAKPAMWRILPTPQLVIYGICDVSGIRTRYTLPLQNKKFLEKSRKFFYTHLESRSGKTLSLPRMWITSRLYSCKRRLQRVKRWFLLWNLFKYFSGWWSVYTTILLSEGLM